VDDKCITPAEMGRLLALEKLYTELGENAKLIIALQDANARLTEQNYAIREENNRVLGDNLKLRQMRFLPDEDEMCSYLDIALPEYTELPHLEPPTQFKNKFKRVRNSRHDYRNIWLPRHFRAAFYKATKVEDGYETSGLWGLYQFSPTRIPLNDDRPVVTEFTGTAVATGANNAMIRIDPTIIASMSSAAAAIETKLFNIPLNINVSMT
jgi:hypothetical protein